MPPVIRGFIVYGEVERMTSKLRAPKGVEAAKAIPGYTEKQKVPQEYTPGISTFRDALEQIINRLAPAGYLMRSEPSGQFCGFNVYELSSPEDLQGLTPDINFQQYRRISLADNIARDTFYSELDSVVSILVAGETNKTLKKHFREVLSDFKDKPSSKRCSTGQASPGFQQSKDTTVTLTGRNGLCKVVPPRAWFDERIQAINARDLLTLWPDAEAEMLMLMLGRIMVGPKDEPTSEGYVAHTMRSYGISVGHEPGLGKSTFLGWLIETLEYLGYSTEPINLRLGTFGWASVAGADLAYVDDLSDESQKALMQLGLIKSIVSGHKIKAEEKGEAAMVVSSRCVILGCSNGSDPSNFIGMDAGAINRCNQLYTRTSSELTEAYGQGDHRIKQRWEALADEHGIEPKALMAWLLRCSVDMFLEASGHSISSRGVLEYDQDKDRLEATVRALRDRFIIKVNLDHAESLVSAIMAGCALYRATLDGVEANDFDRRWSDTDFGPSLVLACLEYQSARGGLDGWDELKVSGLSRACLSFIEPKLPSYRSKAATMSLPELFKAVMGELVSSHGFRYPGNLTFFNPKWSARKRDFKHLVAAYKKRLASEALPETVRNLVNDLGATVV